MKLFNIQKVYYSTENGIICEKVKYMSYDHESVGQKHN